MKLRNIARMYGEQAAWKEYMKDCLSSWRERIRRAVITVKQAIEDAWTRHIQMALRHEETISQAWSRRAIQHG